MGSNCLEEVIMNWLRSDEKAMETGNLKVAETRRKCTS